MSKLVRLWSPVATGHSASKTIASYDGSPDDWEDELVDYNQHILLPQPESPSGKKKPRLSQSLSDRAEDMTQKFYSAIGNPTVVHRPSRFVGSVPFINTNVKHGSTVKQDPIVINNSSLSPPSSYNVSGRFYSTSPMSKASTDPTSIFSDKGSFRSQRSLETRQLPDQTSTPVKAASHPTVVEESCLPPIEETECRSFTIPIQYTTAQVRPTVATVELAAATRAYFELLYNDLLSSTTSSRSMRRRDLEKRLGIVSMTDVERDNARLQWAKTESDHLRQIRTLKSSSLARHEAKGISIAGYQTVRVLGKGSFGVVRLVTERWPEANEHDDSHYQGSDGDGDGDIVADNRRHSHASTHLDQARPREVFAMKVIRKSDMLRSCQEAHLRAERDFLVAAEGSSWIVPLLAAFQDNTNLYLVMEYMVGGDFLGLLLREDVLEESVAR